MTKEEFKKLELHHHVPQRTTKNITSRLKLPTSTVSNAIRGETVRKDILAEVLKEFDSDDISRKIIRQKLQEFLEMN